INISNGGVKRSFSKDGVTGYIYEEYPRGNLNGVLNGYITAIIGIYELSKVDESFYDLFNDNILNLKRILPLYDTGYWSYYALDGNLDSGFYHRYIITQLDSLSEIDSDFCYYSDLFSKYRDQIPNQIKAFYNKVKYKL
ncbi:D-glucuronyl C5-epimerase family protein, partial [Vibrio sp. Isolate31]|uniref:D-glucuronyl C5-epimerase family protein n=1 Tax=Vibrio sp. Isolate31 TaxID=2908537 RepID=UPI001EFEC062